MEVSCYRTLVLTRGWQLLLYKEHYFSRKERTMKSTIFWFKLILPHFHNDTLWEYVCFAVHDIVLTQTWLCFVAVFVDGYNVSSNGDGSYHTNSWCSLQTASVTTSQADSSQPHYNEKLFILHYMLFVGCIIRIIICKSFL